MRKQSTILTIAFIAALFSAGAGLVYGNCCNPPSCEQETSWHELHKLMLQPNIANSIKRVTYSATNYIDRDYPNIVVHFTSPPRSMSVCRPGLVHAKWMLSRCAESNIDFECEYHVRLGGGFDSSTYHYDFIKNGMLTKAFYAVPLLDRSGGCTD